MKRRWPPIKGSSQGLRSVSRSLRWSRTSCREHRYDTKGKGSPSSGLDIYFVDSNCHFTVFPFSKIYIAALVCECVCVLPEAEQIFPAAFKNQLYMRRHDIYEETRDIYTYILIYISICSANTCRPPALVVVLERKTWRMQLQCVRDRTKGIQHCLFLFCFFIWLINKTATGY